MTVESIVIFNVLISLISVWVAMVVNSKFLRPAVLNRKRFKLYELRDELAILAMKGLIKENSEEYLTLLRMMNNSIRATKNFRITSFLEMQYALVKDKELRAHLVEILEKIKHDQMPAEYKHIVGSFFAVAHEMYNHKTWLLRTSLTPLIAFLRLCGFMIKAASRANQHLEMQMKKVNEIEHELESNRAKFAV